MPTLILSDEDKNEIAELVIQKIGAYKIDRVSEQALNVLRAQKAYKISRQTVIAILTQFDVKTRAMNKGLGTQLNFSREDFDKAFKAWIRNKK